MGWLRAAGATRLGGDFATCIGGLVRSSRVAAFTLIVGFKSICSTGATRSRIFAASICAVETGACAGVADGVLCAHRAGAAWGVGGGGLSGLTRLSRRTPRRKSWPSRRQFLVIAENCSRRHLMVTSDPTENGRLTLTQAPEFEVSSSVAGVHPAVPSGSRQETSATAHTVFRGSISRPSMPTVSARRDRGLITWGQS